MSVNSLYSNQKTNPQIVKPTIICNVAGSMVVLTGPVLERSELFASCRRDGEALPHSHITQMKSTGQRRIGQTGEQVVQFFLNVVAPILRLFMGSQRADASGDLDRKSVV